MSTLLNLDSYRHELYEQQQQQLLASPPDHYNILSPASMDTPLPIASSAGDHRQQQQQQQQQQFALSPSYSSYASVHSPSSSSASSPSVASSPHSQASNMSPQSNTSDASASYTLQNLNLSTVPSYHVGIGYQHQQSQPQQPEQQQQQQFYTPQVGIDQNTGYGFGQHPEQQSNDAAYIQQPKEERTEPHLVILEQPVDKFRFRYQSEMHGTHGSLMGARTEKAKKTFPTVELRGYAGEAKIRCSLYQVDPNKRAPHSHHLVIKSGEIDLIDPHDLDVGPGEPAQYVAAFQGMGIIHTAKKFIGEELYKKLRKHRQIELNREPTQREEELMLKEANAMARTMNLNQVCLCFQAYRIELATGQWVPLCEPVYTNAINNMKSALTGELKICRLSATVGSVDGGEEVFMFVEKVCKNNIKIRFYEVDECDREVWQENAIFSEADVHHQYAIAFKTPPYHNRDIAAPVDVYMQLYRPRDGCQSEPIPFRYKPRAGAGGMLPGMAGCSNVGTTGGSRKRLRVGSGNLSSEIPTVIQNDHNGPGSAGGGTAGAGGGGAAIGTAARLPPLHQPFPMLANHTGTTGVIGTTITEGHELTSNLDILGTAGTTVSKELTKQSIIQEILNIPTTIATDVTFDSSDFPCNSEEFNKLIQEIGNQQDLVKLETDAGEDETEADSALVQAIGDFLAANGQSDAGNQPSNKEGDALKKLLALIKLFAGNFTRSRQLLSSHWTAANQQQLNCLHAAIERNDTTIACTLIELLEEYSLCEELLDLPNERNETALHLAVSANRNAIVKALLASGANPNYCDYRGNTALHRAIVENAPEMVSLLLQHKGSYKGNGGQLFDCCNDDGLTPLQAAVYTKNLKLTRMLIEAGANVEEKDLKHGNNILHIAVDNDSLDIVHYLLANVVKCELWREPNNAGYTPLQLADAKANAGATKNKLIVRELLRYDPDGLSERLEHSKNDGNDQDDDEEEEDEEEEEEEEEEDEGEDNGENSEGKEESRGANVLASIDLKCDGTDIARLLEDHKPEPLVSGRARGVSEKSRDESDTASPTTASSKESPSEIFDEKCLEELCRLLDMDSTWKDLGSLLDFHAFFSIWEQSQSPSRVMLDYFEMQNFKVDRLIEMLRALDLREPIRCIDEMICRQMK
uniref:Putative ipt domain of the transcription factor nfkappab n=1 Tax=Anopheles marajoara TaxID=58244 RepID=A0A2M4BAT5_9DIPT